MPEYTDTPLSTRVYPIDDFALVETAYNPQMAAVTETLFALGNGFLGMRGMFEEGRPNAAPGVFVNGFHETWEIEHAEAAFGFAQTGQTIVNVPDPSVIKLYIDDEPLYLPTARLVNYERRLDFRDGVLRRTLQWSTPSGKQVWLTTERVISLRHRHLGALRYQITTDQDAPIVLSSQLVNRQDAIPADERNGVKDPRRPKGLRDRVLNPETEIRQRQRRIVGYRTSHSKMTLAMGIDHELDTANEWECEQTGDGDIAKVVYTIEAQANTPITLTKVFTAHSSRSVPPVELADRCGRSLDRGLKQGFDAILAEQAEFLAHFWSRSDVIINTDGRVQQAMRWNLFQLCQASARAETSGIPAKALTGQAYDGHYFWDTEIFITPFLTYTQPRITRNLLRFRQLMLPLARQRARELSEQGALFPWRTINGEEASSYYAAGTAQYHINADIAYALRRYVDIRGDRDFLADVGAEILLETARMWRGLGFFGEVDKKFHIHGVTGPDEYTTVVNDNAYTNLMARCNLLFAADTISWLRDERPDTFRALCETVSFDPTEIDAWRDAADNMFIPYDNERGIHPQDANFLDREVWDFANTPKENYPLLLHYHPLVIYRHQVIKQADVVLAMVLLSDEFPREQKQRNFAYYDPLTTGDSSLSACMQAIVAADIGAEDDALRYFYNSIFMDLNDVAGNTAEGVHIAAAGGSWMAVTYGFAGMKDIGGQLSFNPRLPEPWREVVFSLRFHARQIKVRLTHEGHDFTLLEGEPITINVCGEDRLLQHQI
jgi:alpha,alpha-trehalose phosphorylase